MLCRPRALSREASFLEDLVFFFASGVAMVLQHRHFIQETLSTGTICSHGYGFNILCLNYGLQKIICLKPTTPEGRDWLISIPKCNKSRDQGKILAEREAKLEQGLASRGGGAVKLDSMWQHRLTRPLHVQHTDYCIIYKQNPFNIISRGVQR